MKNFLFRVCLATGAAFLFQSAYAQTITNTAVLRQASIQQGEKEKSAYQKLEILAKQKGWQMIIKKPKGGVIALVGTDDFGMPIYLGTDNNITAAATIGTNKLWPGGITGLNLSGSSNSVKGKLGIWDGGNLRATHVELVNRINQKDDAGFTSDHATHVAGSLIAAGINPLAKGMSFGQQQLIAYNFLNNSDNSEMMNEAPNLLVSNHSYGALAGWQFNNNRWEFYGPPGSTEDYKFGYYSTSAQLWDSIAYNAPYYLIVKSAGNSRDENGPAVGATYWRPNAAGTFISAPRPDGISNNDTFDILSTASNAKNILVVGAVNPISSGYSSPGDVVMSSFSSWGPTDDGRIKPDVVADGVGVLSSVDASDNAYAIFDGTSMASPNASGSLLLLQEYYSQLHTGTFMRSATLKGLVIHTASEAGPAPGPDYKHGWGLINMQRAAAVITANNTTDLIQEGTLNNGSTVSFNVIASGNGTVSATLSWTDPKAPVEPTATALNNPTVKLMNDLDLVIKKGGTVYHSWTLNPANRTANAVRGDNSLDNVEKVELPDVVPGDTYTIEITHKGTLQRGLQAYSLIVSGVGGVAYCTSAPTVNAGAKIDSVSFVNIQNKNVAGCTTYSNFTNLTASLQQGQSFPFLIRLASCDATTADKIVKVFVDANGDGDFADAGENIATSGVINGNGDFTGNATMPSGLQQGSYTLLRIVMQETNAAGSVNPCGAYTRGETQDYRVLIAAPSTDAGITEIVSPAPGDCANGAQYVAVRIRNFGTVAKNNVPVTVQVKQGAATVATLNGLFPGSIPANGSVIYVLQNSVSLAASTTYTITAFTTLAGDQNSTNDQAISTVTISAPSADPSGTAVICGTEAILKATPADGNVYTWYNVAGGITPVAAGSNTSTSTLSPTYFLGRNEKFSIGPATKETFTTGGQYVNLQNRFMVFNNTVPVTLETVRLYVGNSNNSGKVNILIGRNFTITATTINFIRDAEVTVDIYATDPTPVAGGAQESDPTDLGAVFYLNIPIPVTGDHFIMLHYPSDADPASIFRNSGITANPYPMGAPGVFTFKDNSATYSTPPGNFQQYYYFYYDLKIKTDGCPAASRKTITSTTAVAPTITLAANVLTSSAATGNQWLKDGVDIPNETGATYTPTASGVYSTIVTDPNGCSLTSNTINFTLTAVPNVDPATIGLVVSPVPAKGKFTIQFEVNTKANLDISLINTAGQHVYHSATPNFIGRLTKTINPGKIAAGVYYLQIMHNKKMYIRKVVIAE